MLYWASLGDVFVNVPLVLLTVHASNAGIAANVVTAAGYLMEKLVRVLLKIRASFVAIIGGAKVSDKITIIKTCWKRLTSYCWWWNGILTAAKGEKDW